MNNRESFEEWFSSEMPMESLITNQDNDYKYQPAIASWESWQAAIASQPVELSSNPLQLPAQERQPTNKEFETFWKAEQVRLNSNAYAYEPLEVGYFRCWKEALQSQAQQTESQWIHLRKDDYSHLKGDELIYAYGLGCGIFEAYLRGYEVVRDDMFNRNTSEVTHIMVRRPEPLPPAPEACSDGGKCGAGGYCITCPNVPAPEGDKP